MKRTVSTRSPASHGSSSSPPHQRHRVNEESQGTELGSVPEELTIDQPAMEQSTLIEAFVLALSDPRVTAALNQTIEAKVHNTTVSHQGRRKYVCYKGTEK